MPPKIITIVQQPEKFCYIHIIWAIFDWEHMPENAILCDSVHGSQNQTETWLYHSGEPRFSMCPDHHLFSCDIINVWYKIWINNHTIIFLAYLYCKECYNDKFCTACLVSERCNLAISWLKKFCASWGSLMGSLRCSEELPGWGN
jgi:hypothetical protein